jgi:hypothetical protein
MRGMRQMPKGFPCPETVERRPRCMYASANNDFARKENVKGCELCAAPRPFLIPVSVPKKLFKPTRGTGQRPPGGAFGDRPPKKGPPATKTCKMTRREKTVFYGNNDDFNGQSLLDENDTRCLTWKRNKDADSLNAKVASPSVVNPHDSS